MMWWLPSSIVVTLILLWVLAEWGVWKAIQASYRERQQLDTTEEFPEDVRQGSSMGRIYPAFDFDFEVQEDGTVVRPSPVRWADEPTSGRDDHE